MIYIDTNFFLRLAHRAGSTQAFNPSFIVLSLNIIVKKALLASTRLRIKTN